MVSVVSCCRLGSYIGVNVKAPPFEVRALRDRRTREHATPDDLPGTTGLHGSGDLPYPRRSDAFPFLMWAAPDGLFEIPRPPRDRTDHSHGRRDPGRAVDRARDRHPAGRLPPGRPAA